jgi:hypothetical protein
MSDSRNNRAPPLTLTRLWAKTSAKGNTYLTGRLGALRVLVMENRDRNGDDDATHLLMVAEAGERGGAK